MTNETIGSFAKDLKKEFSEYVDLRLELAKLTAYEKAAKLTGASTAILLIAFFSFFAFLFISFTCGYMLSELLESTFKGFGIVSVIYVLLVVILIVKRKAIETFVLENVIEKLMEEENEQSK